MSSRASEIIFGYRIPAFPDDNQSIRHGVDQGGTEIPLPFQLLIEPGVVHGYPNLIPDGAQETNFVGAEGRICLGINHEYAVNYIFG
jgi:hypothetical protein